jgi:hypothetical protein
MRFPRRALRIVGGVLVVYALLVATHLGEFWPFSIYPMFSQAGNPWTRAVVRELPSQTDPDTLSWEAVSLQELSGTPYPVAPKGINQNDVANYVSKTDRWTDDRVQGLRSLFTKGRTLSSPLLVYRVRGKLEADTVAVTATPVLLFEPDTTRLHPSPAARTVAVASP